MRAWGAIGLALAGLLGGVQAQAQAPAAPGRACEVPAFRGLVQPGGAQARMRVVNTGEPCRVRMLADIETRQPFASIAVTRPPSHGTVTIQAEGVSYRPSRGYSGPDLFEVAASGVARGSPVSGHMRVEVTVLPPP